MPFEVRGRYVDVTASVSNFVPKPHTPYQWNGMQTREYLQRAGKYLRRRCRIRAVKIKQHDIECSLLEGVLTRGDRRIAVALEEAWRRGCRLDGWREPCPGGAADARARAGRLRRRAPAH